MLIEDRDSWSPHLEILINISEIYIFIKALRQFNTHQFCGFNNLKSLLYFQHIIPYLLN